MTPDQPWMWHWGGMWIFPLIMFVVMIIFFVLGNRRPPWWGHRGHHRKGGEMDSALEILKKRYAKGEITKEEFEQMKKDVLS